MNNQCMLWSSSVLTTLCKKAAVGGDTHRFRFPAGGWRLQICFCIFPRDSVAAISGQVLSTDGQGLTVAHTHLASPPPRRLALVVFSVFGRSSQQKSLLTLAHSQFEFSPRALRRWDQRRNAAMQADGELQKEAETQEKTKSHLLVFPLSWSIISHATLLLQLFMLAFCCPALSPSRALNADFELLRITSPLHPLFLLTLSLSYSPKQWQGMWFNICDNQPLQPVSDWTGSCQSATCRDTCKAKTVFDFFINKKTFSHMLYL